MSDINFLGSTSLGKVFSWEDKKAATLLPVPFPGEDSGKTEAVDAMGVIAYSNFSGRWTGDFTVIQGYIAAIKSILDGDQKNVTVIRSPFVNNKDFDKISRRGNIGTNTSTPTNKLVDANTTFTGIGTQEGDYVKNLLTGETAEVSTKDDANTLSLVEIGTMTPKDLFTVTGTAYAVTAHVNSKLLSVNTRWELPGLSYCNYTISLMQVA